jgi:hypothetical protein
MAVVREIEAPCWARNFVTAARKESSHRARKAQLTREKQRDQTERLTFCHFVLVLRYNPAVCPSTMYLEPNNFE